MSDLYEIVAEAVCTDPLGWVALEDAARARLRAEVRPAVDAALDAVIGELREVQPLAGRVCTDDVADHIEATFRPSAGAKRRLFSLSFEGKEPL